MRSAWGESGLEAPSTTRVSAVDTRNPMHISTKLVSRGSMRESASCSIRPASGLATYMMLDAISAVYYNSVYCNAKIASSVAAVQIAIWNNVTAAAAGCSLPPSPG